MVPALPHESESLYVPPRCIVARAQLIQLLQKAWHIHQDVDQNILQVFRNVLPRDSFPLRSTEDESFALQHRGEGLRVAPSQMGDRDGGKAAYHIDSFIGKYVVRFTLGMR